MLTNRSFQIEQQDDSLHVLHVFEVSTAQSGEVKCTAATSISSQSVTHTDLIVLPEIYEAAADDGDTDAESAKRSIDPLLNRHRRDGCDVDDEYDDDDVAGTMEETPAYIIYGPNDGTALIGGTVILEVIYGGKPEPTIKWMRAVSDDET